MNHLTTFLLLLLVCNGCETLPAPPTTAEWRAKLHTVTVADGISESEAQTIGQCYFAKYVGCGVCNGARDNGDSWKIIGVTTIAGPDRDCLFIDKNSGKVSSLIGPSYENPLDIFP